MEGQQAEPQEGNAAEAEVNVGVLRKVDLRILELSRVRRAQRAVTYSIDLVSPSQESQGTGPFFLPFSEAETEARGN